MILCFRILLGMTMLLMAKPYKNIPKFALVTALLLVGLLSSFLLFIKVSPTISVDDIIGIFKPKPEPVLYSSSLMVVPFEDLVIDGQISGDIKLVGDIDGDSYPDLVMGGMPNEKLNWYRYPTWEKSVMAAPKVEFTTDGALGDVDGDGDLDIVVPDGDSQDNLVWFQNPRPGNDPGANIQWQRKVIGTIGSWGKDIELADFDADGRLDVATRSQNEAMIFFQTKPDGWERVSFSSLALGSEGMASGDIDNDGEIDLVLRGNWLRNPGGPNTRISSKWLAYNIGDAPENFKALVTDINLDGVSDVLFSSSEDTADVNWWTPEGGNPTGQWEKHTILPNMEKTHTLQAADIDLDGDMDVVLAQMHTSIAKEIMVLYNQDGQGLDWVKQVIAVGGIHNGVVADIGNDGDYDLFGANWTGNPPVKLFVNHLDGKSEQDHWTYIKVTENHSQTFGLAFGDANLDQNLDILSGGFWYRNPGGDMLSTWEQLSLPPDMHSILTVDVDGDDHLDVIAQKDEGQIGLYWLECIDPKANDWETIHFGSVDQASHNIGAQGYRTAQIVAGGKPEILISSGNGIYYFQIPDQPTNGNWPRVHINSNPSDEGFATGDIDRDGNVDIAGTTGDSKRIEWYQNPGDQSGEWTAFQVGTFPEAVYPDRTELADLNGDGRLDVIVTEENGQESNAKTIWWEGSEDPTRDQWAKHLVTTQATTNSMDVADIDQDGDIDIILGEHRGTKKLATWENDGVGNFNEEVIATGYESHLGGRTVDLDGDGDLDIVSIAWDSSNLIHLFRNDRLSTSPVPTGGGTDPEENISPESQQGNLTATSETQLTRAFAKPLVLFTFEEGNGAVIQDTSGSGDPLDLSIPDEGAVAWLEGGGLRITQSTVLRSIQPATKIIEACQQTGEISVEIWIKPADLLQNGPARIVSLSYDPFFRNFTLGQESAEFEIRLRTTATTENGIPATVSSTNAVRPGVTHVVYTRSQNGETTLYVDDVSITTAGATGDFSNWDPSYPLTLANELSNDRPWLGEYYRVGIYDRALDPDEVSLRFMAGPNGLPNPIPEEPESDSSPTPWPQVTRTQEPVYPAPAATEVQVSQGAESNPGGPFSIGSIFPITLGILLVVALILGGFWVVRRNSSGK